MPPVRRDVNVLTPSPSASGEPAVPALSGVIPGVDAVDGGAGGRERAQRLLDGEAAARPRGEGEAPCETDDHVRPGSIGEGDLDGVLVGGEGAVREEVAGVSVEGEDAGGGGGEREGVDPAADARCAVAVEHGERAGGGGPQQEAEGLVGNEPEGIRHGKCRRAPCRCSGSGRRRARARRPRRARSRPCRSSACHRRRRHRRRRAPVWGWDWGPGSGVGSGVGSSTATGAKCAVTERLAVMVTEQAPDPVQAPDQRSKR